MKNSFPRFRVKPFMATVLFAFMNTATFAQDSAAVTVDKAAVSNWFADNWMWVVGGVVLLLIIGLSAGGSRRKTKTTTVKTNDGVTERTTTTVTEE